LLSALDFLHSRGAALGGFSSDQIFLAAPGLPRLAPLRLLPASGPAPSSAPSPVPGHDASAVPAAAAAASRLESPLLLQPRWDLPTLMSLWRRRRISNL
ncbi:hypothetical protein MNEG_15665, partial [Monoraphidium neglectum]